MTDTPDQPSPKPQPRKRGLKSSMNRTKNKFLRRSRPAPSPTKHIPLDRKSEEFNTMLRNKFIETAKKYIGVPYRQSCLEPTDPNYNAPLFLDCCGLVRQVTRDLKKLFGFKLGRWNQCYQFDTLPKTLTFEEMKAGDLIFYEGRYFDKEKKRQFHDITHVEIYMGPEHGEKTIGARFKTGTIQIFDSYIFESKSWSLTRYHFRSLDTWIVGACRSVCSRHPWRIIKKASQPKDAQPAPKAAVPANGKAGGQKAAAR